jgi:hypothetical protein
MRADEPFPVPCEACAEHVLSKAAELEHTGGCAAHCPHRSLGMVLQFENGKLTHYTFAPLDADQVAERDALVRKYLHEEHGLKRVK